MTSSLWTLIAGATFGLVAFLLKAIFFPAPQFNPSPGHLILAGGLSGSIVWYLVVARIPAASTSRGVLAGSIAGFLTPIVAWPLFGLFRVLTDPAAGDALSWSLVYSFLMLRGVAWLSALLGALLGGFLAWLQKRQDRGVSWPVGSNVA